jgi:hypothetical protein
MKSECGRRKPGSFSFPLFFFFLHSVHIFFCRNSGQYYSHQQEVAGEETTLAQVCRREFTTQPVRSKTKQSAMWVTLRKKNSGTRRENARVFLGNETASYIL